MMQSVAGADLANAFMTVCRLDVEAFKPGNVSLASPGHGMQAQDFLDSAAAAAGPMSAPGYCVGERIYRCIAATRQAVGCNTNLGIILLCAPLAQAALLPPAAQLQARVGEVLRRLDRKDADYAYRAICLAAPGGLGASEAHDVHKAPQVTLLEAMQAAEDRDRIAWQYGHGFADVFTIGVPGIRAAMARGHQETWAATGIFMEFLSCYPDTHIARKWGLETARRVQQEAALLNEKFRACQNPAAFLPELQAFDQSLKSAGINPGTCADLSVASCMAYRLETLLGHHSEAKPLAAGR